MSNDHPAILPVNADQSDADLRWFALRVRPRHEKSASQFLETLGYELFCPTFTRKHTYGTRVRVFQLPLFAGYVFCRFDVTHRLPVLKAPGVVSIVGLGRTPIPIQEDEINSLRMVVSTELPVEPHPFVDVGESVEITAGPLSGIVGTVIRVKDAWRIVLSITLLRRSVLVEVDPSKLVPAEPSVRSNLHAA